MFVLGLVGMAVAAWGMTSVDKNFPANISKQVDTIQEFPLEVINTVDGMAMKLGNFTTPLDNFQAIINQINISTMRTDLADVSDFFTNAPAPATIQALVTAVQTALDPKLSGDLAELGHQIDGTNTSCALGRLYASIATLKGFNASSIHTPLVDYRAEADRFAL